MKKYFGFISIPRVKQFVKTHLLFVFLCLILVILIGQNYQPGTFLTGWDTLHPEFNPGQYMSRLIFGAYQPHQGLGAVASQAHAAEIPRMLFYLPLSFILPLALDRWFYFFLTMISGTIGMYCFLKYGLFEAKTHTYRELISVSGAAFYILNLGTLQHYYNPLEMFPTCFAGLPWLFLFAILYLRTKSKNHFIWFCVATIFASPMAHTATLWYVYFGGLLLFLATTALLYKKKYWKTGAILLLATITLNLYWILPNIYFTLMHGDQVEASKIHSLFNEEAFTKNVEFSTPQDLMLLKSFPFDWGIYGENGTFQPLLTTWSNHLQNPFISFLGYSFFLIILGGVLFVIRKKEQTAVAFLPITLACFFALMTIRPPFGFLFSFAQGHLPFFAEAFRFPFTKFSLLLIFSYAIFFAFGIDALSTFIGKLKSYKPSPNSMGTIILLLLIMYMSPAFSGLFISPFMKVQIPEDYFAMFSYFQNNNDQGRVATLPVQSFWGWVYYNWGYQGAGFTWFGIPQPILEREFDRWSPYNEQYFREISHAVYSEDEQGFIEILHKYDIHYVLLDTSIIAPGADPRSLYYAQIHKLLTDLVKKHIVQQPQQFGNHLFVYQLINTAPYPLTTISKAPIVSPANTVYTTDNIYKSYGDYITDISGKLSATVFFPFLNFTDNHSRVNDSLLTISQDAISLNSPPTQNSFQLKNSDKLPQEIPASILINKTPSAIEVTFYPSTPIFNDSTYSLPIQTTLPLTSNSANYLTINDEVFDISHVELNTPTALGNTFLNQDKNIINLYNTSKVPSPTTPNINPFFTYCNNAGNAANINAFIKRNEINILQSQNHSLCIYIPFTFLPTKSTTQLINLSFSYADVSKLTACVQDIASGTCKGFARIDEAGNQKSIIINLSQQEAQTSQLLLQINGLEQINNEKLTNLMLENFTPITTATISKDELQQSLNTNTLQQFKSVIVPKVIPQTLSNDITQIDRFANDCPAPGDNAVKKLAKDVKTITYSSDAGSFCDHFSYNNLPHSLGYLVGITSKNESGLPLDICVTNYLSKNCDVYTQLPHNKILKTDYYYIPSSDPNGIGYDINIENVGIKYTPAKNILANISVFPFPYEELSNASLPIDQPYIFYPGKVTQMRQTTPLSYAVTTQYGTTLLALSRSYEDGWKAYTVSSINPFTETLPFLFGNEITSHVLINNWKNGWITPNRDKSDIIIIFWPQYLEFFGFLLLVGVVVYFAIFHGRKLLR